MPGLLGRLTAWVLVAGVCVGAAAQVTDTWEGPIATAAKAALAKGDVTPVLRWVNADQEPALKAAFDEAKVVRDKGPEAQALAEKYFAETLVRLHRVGRDEPYTGIAAAGAQPAIQAVAERVAAAGTPDELIKAVAVAVAESLTAQVKAVNAAQAQADESVDAGRTYVAAYTQYLAYVAELFEVANRMAADEDAGAAAGLTAGAPKSATKTTVATGNNQPQVTATPTPPPTKPQKKAARQGGGQRKKAG